MSVYCVLYDLVSLTVAEMP